MLVKSAAPQENAVLARSAWVALLIITLVGAFFRLYRLDQRGMLFVDEGCYLVESRLHLAGAKLLMHQLGLYKAEDSRQILDYIALRTFSHVSAKPMHAAFGALGLWLFGDSIRSVLLISAIFGILSIPFLFFFTQRLFQDIRISLLSAGILAISPWHISYCRSWWSEVPGILLMWVAVWCYYEAALRAGTPASHRWMWTSGIVGGLSFTCNTRWLFLPLVFFFFMTVEKFLFRRPVGLTIANAARFLAGFVLILLLWEIPYHWALVAQKTSGMRMQPFYTFWETLGLRMKYAVPDWRWESFPVFLYYLLRTEGPVGVLMLGGIVVAMRSARRFESTLILAMAGTGFLFFWMLTWKVLIYMSFTIPAFCILAALAVQKISGLPVWTQRPRLRIGTFTAMAVVGMAYPFSCDWQQCWNASKLPEAIAWLRQNHPQERVLATSYEPALCEYDNAHIAPLSTRVELDYLAAAHKAGVSLLMIDHMKFNAVLGSGPAPYPDYPPIESLLPSAEAFTYPTIAAIETSTKPVATFTNEFNHMSFFFFAREHTTYLNRSRLFLRCVDPAVDSVIRIYDLDEVLRNVASTEAQTSRLLLTPQGN